VFSFFFPPKDEEEMPKNFVEYGLNIIVKRLTGISHFFSKHEMDCNAMGIYFGDKSDKGVQRQRKRAEKKVRSYSSMFVIGYSMAKPVHSLSIDIVRAFVGTSTFDYLCCSHESTSIGEDSLETFVRAYSTCINLLYDV
jgi:hypothetical protein